MKGRNNYKNVENDRQERTNSMSEHEHHHKTVTIIINHNHLESPSPTSGTALYGLGGIPAGDTLFREVPGEKNDKPIARDSAEIQLQEGEKFYSEKGDPKPTEAAIVIDRNRVLSPFETTGAALYVLGKVPNGFTLYREVSGPREDDAIPNNANKVTVHEDEKFYSSPGHVTPGAA
jgi:hypothetical protein